MFRLFLLFLLKMYIYNSHVLWPRARQKTASWLSARKAERVDQRAFYLITLHNLCVTKCHRSGTSICGYSSQLYFLPGLRDGLLKNPSGQLVFQQFTVIVGIVVAFYFVASGAVNVAAKLANTRSKEISDAESKYEAFKPVELGERDYLARREAAKQS